MTNLWDPKVLREKWWGDCITNYYHKGRDDFVSFIHVPTGIVVIKDCPISNKGKEEAKEELFKQIETYYEEN